MSSSSTTSLRPLGGDAGHIQLASIGYGAMGLSWTGAPPPDEQAFACINAALEALPAGSEGKLLVNLGVFYSGKPGSPENLLLFRRYMDAYPDNVARIAISIKGGMGNGGFDLTKPDSSVENMRKELKMCKEVLGDKKEIELYEPARRDRSLSPEEITANLKTLIGEGLFQHISLSEVGADTIRRAAKVHPIAAVEIEYNPFLLEIESNGVLDACKENDIAIIAYSPVGRGFFTHGLTSRDQLKQGDPRLHQPRFNEENFDLNLKLVKGESTENG